MAMSSGKKTLLLMIFVFVAPIVIGTLMFLNADRLQLGSGTVNYGTLITPPVSISATGMDVDGKAAVETAILREKWTLLYVAPDSCEQQCTARIDLLKRLRLLTNEDMRRLRTVALFKEPPQDQAALTHKNPDLIVGTQNSQAAEFLEQFPSRDNYPIYVIDPLGNLMMYYAEDAPDVKRMLKDFKRILKYSHIG